MALFTARRPQHLDGQYRPLRRQRPQPGLPNYLKQLELFCRNTDAHPLPILMKCIGESLSDRGQKTAIYACPHKNCDWREGWVPDRRNPRRPYRLWAKHNRH
jgi:hypothetical protein